MILSSLPLPVASHPTFDIHDASKVQEFMDCPRKYFYRYVLGLTLETTNHHLVFGQAFHKAMEILLRKGYNKEALQEAFTAFMKLYRSQCGPETDDQNAPKTPENALIALDEYIRLYQPFDNFKVLHTEIAGSVTVSEGRQAHFRIDAILEDDRWIFALDHKTTKSVANRQWKDQWTLSMQMGLYTHVLYCLYDPSKVFGVKVNGIGLQKTKVDFERVPVRKTPETMQAWLWNFNHFLDMIEQEFQRLGESRPSDVVMQAFPQNTQSCTKYFGCPYLDLCQYQTNPLRHLNESVAGFTTEWWDPRENDKDATETVDLTEGMK